jgi:hypothetical protein
MDMDIVAWLSTFKPEVLKVVVDFIHKECDIKTPSFTLETTEGLANYILTTIKEQSKIDNPTNAFIWLLGLYHFKSTACPVWNKIHYNDSVFGRFF